jgi:hypothetical protein
MTNNELLAHIADKVGTSESSWLNFIEALDDLAAENCLDLADLVEHVRDRQLGPTEPING